MRVPKLLTCRRSPSAKRSAIVTAIAMMIWSVGGPLLVPQPVQAQTAPIGNGFVLDVEDLRFIFKQIQVAQNHATPPSATCPTCGTLLGPGPNQVNAQAAPFGGAAAAQLPMGLRTVDGSYNNLIPVPDQHLFGASDQLFPRLTTPVFRAAEAGTSYTQTSGNVIDSQPRIITNLIVDQSAANPAAVAAATNPCGSGGFVCQGTAAPDPASGALFIPNITPNFGLGAPFNLMFTFFGQFFDHGLDLVNKGGNGAVIMPLQPDDPLFVAGSPNNFMVMNRATMQPGPDGILGTADDIHDSVNQTTPWVDQNQTYTSHPSHQVFLRQYQMVLDPATGTLKPLPDGKVLDGGFCSPRGTGIPGDNICNIGNWGEVKAQASTKLGIHLVDTDIFDVPLVLTDPYGHFKPGPHGFPQLVIGPAASPTLLEGDPAANGGLGVAIPATALHTNHQFLNDIAHNAVPNPGLTGVRDGVICDFRTVPSCQPPGTYDGDLLDAHFVTGDGRGNENIALTTMHNLFHAEHNRLRDYIDQLIPTLLTPTEVAAWHAVDPGSGWGYGERLFQAARFGTEMQYQHLVFEEFARTVQPLINPFLGGITSINGVISAEFAHTVYRLGHSMLPEVLGRINTDGSTNNIRLLNAFLAPQKYNDGGPAGPLPAAAAAGSIIRGLSLQVGNELDEFVTSSVRNTLVGLPLDLPAINIARGRSEGIPPLNEVRRQFFLATQDPVLKPYANWTEFGLALRHFQSLPNFIAAYGTHPSITAATTVAAKRAAAQALVTAGDPLLNAPAATSGLNNVDFWPGGMAEKPNVFGGLLGTTFNFVFEHQLENLQNGDRFYYLQRTDGLNMRAQLEGNSLAELARRNTTAVDTMDKIFSTADFNFDGAALIAAGSAPIILEPLDPNSAEILTLGDGTKVFFDPLHRGRNIMFSGGPGDDRFRGDVGDDTLFGNGGNDRLDGGEGDDTIQGGDGDDILLGGNGNDVLKGGPGNDALNSGPGFGGDILIGGDGNDFMVGGDDGVEYFAGPGNDIIVDGAMRAEAIVGGPGDDWIYDGDGHDGGIFGDNGNIFDLLAGLDPFGGDDVLGGGPGQDNHFGEGGNDIFLMSEGSNKFFGDYGFDIVTLQNWPAPEFVELSLLAQPGVILNFNDLRNRYRLVDGASGWDLNDHLAGGNHTTAPGVPIELQLIPGMELTPDYAAKVTGLTELMTAFGQTLPWIGGDLLMGGNGSDVLEGKGGDDLLDGDVWLHVSLKATLNDGTVKIVDDPRLLVDDVFADPQRLNPGSITIVRQIVTPVTPPADCNGNLPVFSATGAVSFANALGQPVPAPLNCDVAVYNNPRAEYHITALANGNVIVDHVVARAKNLKSPAYEGIDTLRNIELIQFSDVTIAAPKFTDRIVPSVIGLTPAAAAAKLAAVGLTVGVTTNGKANVTNPVPIGNILNQNPPAGTVITAGGAVDLVISTGIPVPNVVGLNYPGTVINGSVHSITEAGMVVGTITTVLSATVPAGVVISQAPAAEVGANLGTAVNLVVSAGGTTVPNVVGSAQAAASGLLTTAGLTTGTVTFQASATVPAGNVISENPVAGTLVKPGTPVNLVVSSGVAPTIAATVSRNSSVQASTITSPLITPGANTLLVALVATDAPDPCCAPNTVVNSVTNNGTALTWTRAVRSNVQLGTSEIWWAFTPTAHAAMNVTATTNNLVAASLTVMAFTGASSSLVGAATAAVNGASGPPVASLVTTRGNSIVLGVGNDWDSPRVMIAGTGQTIINQFNPTVGDTYWMQRSGVIPAANTSVTINDSYTLPMTDRWNLALVEIRQP